MAIACARGPVIVHSGGHADKAIDALREAGSITAARGRSRRHAEILDLAADIYRRQGMDESAAVAYRTAAGLRTHTDDGPRPEPSASWPRPRTR